MAERQPCEGKRTKSHASSAIATAHGLHEPSTELTRGSRASEPREISIVWTSHSPHISSGFGGFEPIQASARPIALWLRGLQPSALLLRQTKLSILCFSGDILGEASIRSLIASCEAWRAFARLFVHRQFSRTAMFPLCRVSEVFDMPRVLAPTRSTYVACHVER